MTITARGYWGTYYNPTVKPYKLYAVKAIEPHPTREDISVIRFKNGKATQIFTADIIEVKEGRK